ncbi:MAG TPA: TolC family protein, partial [Gemmatimonadaceae bacterium]|nr:TolC family protein [Gemmatimonadaceae bacterium]
PGGHALAAAALLAAAAVAGAPSLGPALGAQTQPPVATVATGAQPRVITLREAVDLALQRNITLRQAENASALDELAVRTARQAFLPDFSFSTRSSQSYGRNFSQEEGRIVNQTTESVSAGVQSSMTLWDGGGNRANLRQARTTESAGELALDRAKQTVVFDVLSNYLALLEQQEQIGVRREALAAQEAQETQVKAFVDAGVRPISDLYQQQATVAAARVALVQTERALALAETDLIRTLQLDPRGTYSFARPEVADTSVAADLRPASGAALDSLMTLAFASRADLEAQETRLRAAEEGISVARANRRPSVSLSMGYNSTYNSASEISFIDQFDQRRGGSVGVGISVPIFDRGATSVATERAQVQVDNARLALEDLRQEVALQVRRAVLDRQATAAQLAAAEAQLRAAELALQSSRERYEVGAATLLELTQARAAQVEAAAALVSARYTYTFQRALLDYYTGELDAGNF